MIVKICIVLLLLVIIYQDFKYLAISWWTIPVLVILGVFHGIQYVSTKQLLTGFSLNIAFLVFQIVILTLYFSIKNRKLTNITKNYLGLGDILFFIFLAISFEPIHFILFLTTSLLVVLILFVVLRAVRLLKNEQLPLAGGISFVYIVFLVITSFYNYNTYSFDTINSLMF